VEHQKTVTGSKQNTEVSLAEELLQAAEIMQLVPGKSCCASTRELSSCHARLCAITDLASEGAVFPVGSPLIVCICAKVSQTKRKQRSFQGESALLPHFPLHSLFVSAMNEANSEEAEAVRSKKRGEMSGPKGSALIFWLVCPPRKCRAAATQA